MSDEDIKNRADADASALWKTWTFQTDRDLAVALLEFGKSVRETMKSERDHEMWSNADVR